MQVRSPSPSRTAEMRVITSLASGDKHGFIDYFKEQSQVAPARIRWQDMGV